MKLRWLLRCRQFKNVSIECLTCTSYFLSAGDSEQNSKGPWSHWVYTLEKTGNRQVDT